MMNHSFKRRDGFEGEKLISLPPKIIKDNAARNSNIARIYITHIGYFPKASYHYRERRNGCEDNILIYCINGKGNFILGDRHFEVTPNQYILIPATSSYMRYWADRDDPWTIYWVHFSGVDMDGFNRDLNITDNRGPVSIPFNTKTIDLWQYIYQNLEMGYGIDNLCNANFCLYHLVAAFLFPDKHLENKQTTDVDIITASILHMKEHLSDKLSVEDISGQFSLSTSYFSSIFKKATGMSPIDYFIQLKMQRACQLLYIDDSKIKKIAADLGYDDPYYFSRAFKKCMGISPEQYKLNTQKTP